MATHTRKTPADENLRLRIDAFRLRKNMSVTALATAVGLKRSAVSHWITGRSEPPRSKIPRLAEALGVSIERLMGKDLTPEQREAERLYLERVVRHGQRIAELLDRYPTDDLIRLLEEHAPPKGDGTTPG